MSKEFEIKLKKREKIHQLLVLFINAVYSTKGSTIKIKKLVDMIEKGLDKIYNYQLWDKNLIVDKKDINLEEFIKNLDINENTKFKIKYNKNCIFIEKV